jgi:hypothetical protein
LMVTPCGEEALLEAKGAAKNSTTYNSCDHQNFLVPHTNSTKFEK